MLRSEWRRAATLDRRAQGFACRARGNPLPQRAMFIVYWVVIVAGLIAFLIVGLLGLR